MYFPWFTCNQKCVLSKPEVRQRAPQAEQDSLQLKKGCPCNYLPHHLEEYIIQMSVWINILLKSERCLQETLLIDKKHRPHTQTNKAVTTHTTMPQKKTTTWPQHVALTAILLNHYKATAARIMGTGLTEMFSVPTTLTNHTPKSWPNLTIQILIFKCQVSFNKSKNNWVFTWQFLRTTHKQSAFIM